MENSVSILIVSEKNCKRLYQLGKKNQGLERQFIAIYLKSESFAFCSYFCKVLKGVAFGHLEAHDIYFHCTYPGVSSRYDFQNQIHNTESFGFSGRVNSHFTLVGYVNPSHQQLGIMQKGRKIFWTHGLAPPEDAEGSTMVQKGCSQNSYSRKKKIFSWLVEVCENKVCRGAYLNEAVGSP